jgi:anhydro-N-acetylmuramic acid kinase
LFSEKTKHKTIVPSAQIIDFKEAIIFAFLGVLRLRNEVNCLKSVTGADHDHSGGAIYLP